MIAETPLEFKKDILFTQKDSTNADTQAASYFSLLCHRCSQKFPNRSSSNCFLSPFHQVIKQVYPNKCQHCVIFFSSKLKCFVLSLALLTLSLLYVYHNNFNTIISSVLTQLEQQDFTHSLIIFMTCFTLVSFPFMWGYIIFNLAAGYFHGFFWGLATVIFSVAFGTFVCHLVCKYYFSSCAVNIIKTRKDFSKIQAILHVLDSPSGIKIIALLRLTPIPFGLQNALVAISNVSIRQYMISSTVGLFPTQALNCYMGSNFRSIRQITNNSIPGGYYIVAAQILIGVLLTWFIVKQARLQLDQALSSSQLEEDAIGEKLQKSLSTDTTVVIEMVQSDDETL